MTFPHHDAGWYRARLAAPLGRVRVVIDTDAANEIDDPFAIAWALLNPQRLEVVAVYAAPYSFEHRRQEMLRARVARDTPARASADDRALLVRYAARLAHFERRGWPIERAALPIFDPPGIGMERSHAAIVDVYDALRLPAEGRVFRGSERYLTAGTAPPESAATRHLIAIARASPPGEPLYVLALGCVTNIASALLQAPDLVDRLVVVWTSGYPSHAPQVNDSFNLEQDLLASQLLFDSGVPLVYLPGYQVGAQLRLSLPEIDRWVAGRGAIGAHLQHLYTHNPLAGFTGTSADDRAYSWVIWDLICVAWLLDGSSVPSEIVDTPALRDDKRWRKAAVPHPMREAYGVARDAIFGDFFAALERAPA